jgi:putative transposase
MTIAKPYRPSNQRLAPELYEQAGRVTFITICALRPASPFINEPMNESAIATLRTTQAQYGCVIYTYCLMPDHLHFLIAPQNDGSSVLTFCDRFKGMTTRQSWNLNWHGKLWQRRSYDHVVRADEDLRAIAQYILDNPVRKGLCASSDEWRWGGQMNSFP